jgi:hypothetical protein
VQLVGAVNLTALFAGIGPLLWPVRGVDRAVSLARGHVPLRTGLSPSSPLWWLMASRCRAATGRYPRFTESIETVSATSTYGSCGLGYWFFWARWRGPWNPAMVDFAPHGVVFLSISSLCLALSADGALATWRLPR